MPNPFDTRRQQILASVQTAAGTFEPGLGAAHGKTRLVFGGVPDYDAPKERRNISRNSGTPYGTLSSTKALAMALRSEINTPDTITDDLEYGALVRSCGHAITQYRRLPLTGAITAGPIARNATMTGTTSGATGRVLLPAATGDTHIYYLVLTGTFQAEALTFSGGASANSSAVSALWGRAIDPVNATEVASLDFEEDGYHWAMRDAMGSMGMEFENSKAGYVSFAMKGVKHLIGKKTMTSGIAFDVEDPPIFQDALVKIGSAWFPVVTKVTFEQGAKVVARGDANATGNTGLRGFRISGERPSKFKISVEHVDEDTFDYFTAHDSGTKYPFQMRCGNVEGKSFWAFADQGEISITGLPDGDGIRQAEIEVACTHTTDNREYQFLTA